MHTYASMYLHKYICTSIVYGIGIWEFTGGSVSNIICYFIYVAYRCMYVSMDAFNIFIYMQSKYRMSSAIAGNAYYNASDRLCLN